MTREGYKAQLESHKKKAYKSKTDALFEVAYLLGMWGADGLDNADPIRLEMVGLAAHYACEIEKEIREGKRAQIRLKNLSDETEEN